MIVVYIVALILNIILLIYGAYFGITCAYPLLKKEKKGRKYKPKYKFAILIAARNEEEVIPHLIDSLKSQDYPKDMYEIFVIPNNCTDKTREVSQKHGARIISLNKKTKTKGEVLNYTFNQFENDDRFNAYVIFDADNVASPNFLLEINNKMCEGYGVVQGFRDTKNPYDNWISASYAIFYYLQNLFLYETRMRIKKSANINGTGYAIRKDLVASLNFSAKTITEDIELTTVCAIHDIKIAYQKKAIFFDEQVTSFMASVKQRKRWSKGTLEILKHYLKDLLKAMATNKNLHSFDMLCINMAVPMQIIGLIGTLLSLFIYFDIRIILLSGVISYSAYTFMALFLSIYNHKNIRKMLPGILLFALFIFTWLPISLYALFSKNNKWDPIRHSRKVDIQELLD